MTRSRLLTTLFGLFMLAAFVQPAAAHYDPKLGRWLERDPAGTRPVFRAPIRIGGQYRDGMTLYQYVRSRPITAADPYGLYEIDVHKDLTTWLAKHLPCLSSDEAEQIGNANQGQDENPEYAPSFGGSDEQRERNRKYHAIGWCSTCVRDLWAEATFSPVTYVQDDPGTARLETVVRMKRNCDLDALGRFLHYIHDTFSHEGFDDSTWGHGFSGHSPDKTANDPQKAMRMAGITNHWLHEWLKACRPECYCANMRGKEVQIAPDWKKLKKFIEAPGGPWWRTISDEERERKRRILND